MIKEIKIKNFKGFVDETVGLKPLTIFAGLNGMGKSTIIQTFLLLRQSYLSGRFPSKGGLLLNGDLSTNGLGKDVFALDAIGDNIEISLDIEGSHRFDVAFVYDSLSDVLPVASYKQHLPLDDFSLFNDSFQYLHAERLSPERDFFPGSLYNVRKKWLGKNGQYTVHYLAENQRNPIAHEALKHPDAKTFNILDNVDAWLSEISPGIKVKPSYNFETNSSILSYNYTIGDDASSNLKPVNVGFGITYILPVITALLVAKQGDILIIENPESHIHPSGQAAIARLCCISASLGIQVIIETHSDHTINGILLSIKRRFEKKEAGISKDDVAMYFIDRQYESFTSQITPVVVSEAGKIRKAPANFFDQFAKDIKEMMNISNENISKSATDSKQ